LEDWESIFEIVTLRVETESAAVVFITATFFGIVDFSSFSRRFPCRLASVG
jgi:hypothetical protein